MGEMTTEDRLEYLRKLEVPPGHEGLVKITPSNDTTEAGYVSGGSLVSFVAGVSGQARQDVLDSTLLAQLVANRKHPGDDDIVAWYELYSNVLESGCAWNLQGKGFDQWESHSSSFTVDKVFFEVLAALLSGDELLLAESTVKAIQKLADDDERVRVFDSQSSHAKDGKFQVSLCTQTNDAVAMKMAVFYFSTSQSVTNVLWFHFTSSDTSFYKGDRTLTLNEKGYAQVREEVATMLGDRRRSFIRDLEI
ncbi:hypothetical protein [Streptomyces griseus]|uniref:hypothetical protein n=1 Tax=Streptomyces griseus TaxID=1911 RepID=UPI0033B5999A